MAHGLTCISAGLTLLASTISGAAAAVNDGQSTAACRTYHAQVKIEELALRLLQSPQMQSARDAAGQQWRQDWGPVSAQAEALFPQALEELAFNAALKTVVQATHPLTMTRGVSRSTVRKALRLPGSRYGWDNTDNIYGSIPVDPRASYRVTGELTTGTNLNLSVLTRDGQVVSNLPKDQIRTDAAGRFELSVGPSVDDDIPLPADASHIMIRETMADWATDRPIYLDVLQTAGPVHEVPSVDQMAIKAAQSVAVMVGRMKGWREALYRKHPANVFVQPWPGQTSQGGLPNQAYSIGYYQLADNEALVFRIETGGADYFSFQLSDIWGTSGNFVDHVSTLTNKQARAEADGSYTFVLTTRDPGHYNWISTQGWREGDVTLRWQGVAGTPRISVQKVTIAGLAGELPQGSLSLSAKHRQQQIAARTVNPYAKWMHAACAGQK